MTLPDFVEPLGPGLYAIDTGFIRPLYDAAYLVVSDGRAAFIDTGTNHALPRHLAALDALRVAREAVDYVMPTHVHLDHAGGAGALMRELPNATLAIHPRGERHMVDPAALYEGALAVYGAEVMARDYGQLVPVPAERVRVLRDGDAVTVGSRTLVAADTPGHARHHHCYWDEASRGWFTGDTFGISLREFDRPGTGAWVGPSIVPSQFDPVALRASIARLVARDPACAYVTHYGRVDDPSARAAPMLALMDRMIEIGRAQRSAPRERLTREFEALYLDALAAHGVTDRDATAALVAVDIELAVQGLSVWLGREVKENKS
ncbi:MAG: MBL fold metallo-hydrolase [Aquincola sp.]|nr:MBL fold metallo-hydrolase [Aquincola sp.]MDH5328605.1 MBL fold metallo-hydrolase [Aquincola sp.]